MWSYCLLASKVCYRCQRIKTALNQFSFAGQSGAQRATIAKLRAQALRPESDRFAVTAAAWAHSFLMAQRRRAR